MVNRESLGGCAYLREEHDGVPVYLANWNQGWKAWSWVGGHKHDGESFRDCVIREVQEELGLTPEIDYTVAPQERKRMEMVAMSASSGVPTNYVLVWHDMRLVNEAARQRLAADPQVRWLTEREIIGLRTTDGQPVSSTMLKLLETQE